MRTYNYRTKLDPPQHTSTIASYSLSNHTHKVQDCAGHSRSTHKPRELAGYSSCAPGSSEFWYVARPCPRDMFAGTKFFFRARGRTRSVLPHTRQLCHSPALVSITLPQPQKSQSCRRPCGHSPLSSPSLSHFFLSFQAGTSNILHPRLRKISFPHDFEQSKLPHPSNGKFKLPWRALAAKLETIGRD